MFSIMMSVNLPIVNHFLKKKMGKIILSLLCILIYKKIRHQKSVTLTCEINFETPFRELKKCARLSSQFAERSFRTGLCSGQRDHFLRILWCVALKRMRYA